MQGIEVIGVDHGYKNIKTAHSNFPTCLSALATDPDDVRGVLGIDGNNYTIYGKTVSSVEHHNKSISKEFYFLTLAAMAKELEYRNKNKAKVILAVGLPYKWLDVQKNQFRDMLFQTKNLTFTFEGKLYHIILDEVMVFAQGICAVLKESRDISNYVLVDLGGETMDIIPFINGIPDKEASRISTNASIYCQTSIAEKIESKFFERISETEIIQIILSGEKKSTDPYVIAVQDELKKYAADVMTTLREFKINVDRTKLVFCGGGSYIIKNFGVYNKDKVKFISDIHANAKGFEVAAKIKCKQQGRR